MVYSLFIIPVRDLAPASSLSNFKLTWKMATLFALVTAKHCFDLTLLCSDNQHLFFFSVMLFFFIAASGDMTN